MNNGAKLLDVDLDADGLARGSSPEVTEMDTGIIMLTLANDFWFA